MKTSLPSDAERRVTALLREAADWEADAAPPLGMADRALARQKRRPRRRTLWIPVGAAASVFVIAAAIRFTAAPPARPAAADKKTVAAVRGPVVPSLEVAEGRPTPHAAPFHRAALPLRRHPLRHRPLSHRPLRHSRPLFSHVPAATLPPPRAQWKTEPVEQMRYALLTPAVLTETNPEDGSEESVPVFVSIPVTDSTDSVNP